MPEASTKTTLSPVEALVLSTICFGLFILWSLQAVLDGFPQAEFNDSGDAWMIGIELTLAAAALLFLRARRFDTASLYPHPTLRGSLLGLALFFAGWLAGLVATSFFHTPGERQAVEFSYSGLSLAATVAFAMVNGAFEEVFLLGALVRGLRGFGLSIAIGVPLLVRVLYHLYQGPLGMVWILSIGATLTLGYIVSRQLWPSVLAHILWDIVPVLL